MENEKVKPKKKVIYITLLIIIMLIISFFVIKNNYKNIKLGNNIIVQNPDSIVNNILNIKSYEANVTVKVISNKNENTYELEQKNIKEKEYLQIVRKPPEIEGMEIIFRNNKLEIKNSKLNLTKIYEEYQYVTENELDLMSFVKECSNLENEKKIINEEEQVIIDLKIKNESNKYIKYKKIYIDKKTGKILKMEIKDITQNIRVYILYNEIKINALQ